GARHGRRCGGSWRRARPAGGRSREGAPQLRESLRARMRNRTATAQETEDLGGRLARARPAAGESLAVLYLSGELGAGKTTFARGFLRALGVADEVRSPTYTLIELYRTGALTAVHVDLYRVRDAAELDALGLREWACGGHLWLIPRQRRGAACRRAVRQRRWRAAHPGFERGRATQALLSRAPRSCRRRSAEHASRGRRARAGA